MKSGAETVENAPARAGRLAIRLLLALAALGLLSVWMGHSPLGGAGMDWGDPLTRQIVWDIRLPRTLGAFAAGALLGLAGAIAQAVFRNPLADPFLLGSASGASLAVAVAMGIAGASPWAMEGWPRWGLSAVAFGGALGAVCLTLMLARGVQAPLRLLLSGVVVGVVLGAFTALWLTFHPALQVSMQIFNLGSVAYVGWSACAVMLLAAGVALAGAWALGRALDALALGDDTARSLGLGVSSVRRWAVALLSLATGAAVAQVGLVAFVGLVSPHLVRGFVRTGHRILLPLVAMAGGTLLVAADVMSRLIWPPQEVPVGVLTAVLGGGYLLWLMRRSSGLRQGDGA